MSLGTDCAWDKDRGLFSSLEEMAGLVVDLTGPAVRPARKPVRTYTIFICVSFSAFALHSRAISGADSNHAHDNTSAFVDYV